MDLGWFGELNLPRGNVLILVGVLLLVFVISKRVNKGDR
jgi:hypothetical protein